MGLDFRTEGIPHVEDIEETAHWSYGGFNRFRIRLAAQSGINLYEMEGFSGDRSWEAYTHLPLYPLLNHADNEGQLTPLECRQIIPALEKIIRLWPAKDSDTRQARLLIEHMVFCVEANRALVFC